MRTIARPLVLAALLVLAGCGKDEPPKVWSPELIDLQVSSCMATAAAGEAPTSEETAQNRTFCSCMFEEVVHRFTFEDYLSRQREVLRELVVDGTQAVCFRRATEAP